MRIFLDWIRKLILSTVLIVSGIMLLHIVIVTVGTHFTLWQTDNTPFYAALSAFICYVIPLAALLLIYLMISELIYIETNLTCTITNALSERMLIRAETKAALEAIKEAKIQSAKDAKELKAQLAKAEKEIKAQSAKKVKARSKASSANQTIQTPIETAIPAESKLHLKDRLFRKGRLFGKNRKAVPPQV